MTARQGIGQHHRHEWQLGNGMSLRWCATFLAMLLTGVGVMAEHDLLRPAGINYAVPAGTVPDECARFFSPTGWGDGAWDGGRPHELHVIAIEADCSATVLYGYGGWRHAGTGDWFSLSARIKRDRLVVSIPEHDAVATYVISEDSKTLSGLWEKNDDSASALVVLRRLD